MRSDIALGLVTFLMAVLGGVVSAHAPVKPWHKALYIFAFVALGAIGLFFVVKQSNETAIANEGLAKTLVDLQASTTETARIQGNDTKLQERLLAQSQTIASLAKEGIDTQTGGDSYPIVISSPGWVRRGTSSKLIAMVRGKHNLPDVTIAVLSHMQNNTPAHLEEQRLNPEIYVPSLLLHVKLGQGIGIVTPQGDKDVYSVQMITRKGFFNETLIFTLMPDGYHSTWVVSDTTLGRIREKQD